jgi:5-methyltetrahydropteroyltriglutamate--homocysteine methyltransferase
LQIYKRKLMEYHNMVVSSNLGFPRIGAKRELKKAVESFWKGKLSEAELQAEAKTLRKLHWQMQKDAGIDLIPSNDFSFYDQSLDTIALVGAVPARYEAAEGPVGLETYFAMARGQQTGGKDVTAMEMTKWLDTNYHYIVPELGAETTFRLSTNKIVDEYVEAKELGIETKPVLLGPVSFLLFSKSQDENFNALSLLPKLLPVYAEVLTRLEAAGAQWIQIDEPALVLDQEADALDAYNTAFASLSKASSLKILLATYFDDMRDNAKTAFALPVDAVHVDLVRAPQQLDAALKLVGADQSLSLGVVDGRNIWRADLDACLATVQKAVDALGSDRVIVGPSCSLLHSPVDLDSETALDDELKSWLAFAKQKLSEISAVAKAANGEKDADAFTASAAARDSKAASPRVHNQAVKDRTAGITEEMKSRNSDYAVRAEIQRPILNLPLLPSTTIGSFPQTVEVRQARAKFRKGELTREQYQQFLEEETVRTIRIQEDLGLNVRTW